MAQNGLERGTKVKITLFEGNEASDGDILTIKSRYCTSGNQSGYETYENVYISLYDQVEVISGNKKVNLSEVTEKVDNALWFEKTIASNEAFKSKPGYALAAVVKVLLAKGVLTPSDFDLLTSEESAVTPVPANKD